MNLAGLQLHGFDKSYHVPFTKQFHVACSQCEALCINGVPTHETGCRNERHECGGCNEVIPMNQRYCKECQL